MMTRKRKLSDEGDVEDEYVPSEFESEISSDDESNQEDPTISLLVQVEYAFLSCRPEIKKQRGLNTLIDGLAEIGINKKLIQNKQLLADLVTRRQEKCDLVNTQSDMDNSGGTDSDST
jgi:hypothetical protein